MKAPAGWGPSHQTAKRRRGKPLWFQVPLYGLALVLLLSGLSVIVMIVLFLAGGCVLW